MQLQLEKKIKDKTAKVAVIGLGYVGLPLAVDFAKSGYEVVGIDTDSDRVSNVKEGLPYILDVDIQDIKKVVSDKMLLPTTDFRRLGSVDVIIICVPTPLKRKAQPNIAYIKEAVRQIKLHLKKGQLIVLESTTYPGTTDEVILPILESTGLKCGEDFFLVFSPERIDPGNEKFPFKKIPKVVGGVTESSARLFKLLYENVIERVVVVSSARAAETVKLLENTFRLVNIGLVNELAMMCQKMKLDIWEIIDAARTKPFGFMAFYPGPGVGGHCLDKNENIFVKDDNSLKIMQMQDFIEYIQDPKNDNAEVLSFDPHKKRAVFKKVIAASARPYSGQMINIITEDGRYLKVTDLHPLFIYNDNKWKLKYAKELQRGDQLAISLDLPKFDRHYKSKLEVDLIKQISHKGQHLIDKIRVRPSGFQWRAYAQELKCVLRQNFTANTLPDCVWDYLSNNYLPLKYFYLLEKIVRIDHSKVELETGRGPTVRKMPAKLSLDKDFFRLIGYYLSEGCYTKDKSARIRFSFNRSEKEYICDCLDILHSLGLKTSIYESKIWHSSCIKVSSDLFGFLIYDILGCGKNCYDMKMPEQLFSLDLKNKKNLLAGLLRGDASVEHFFGKWRYRKNEKEYFHNVNTAHISFMTSSKKLFQQLIVLLQDLNIVPTFGRRKYTLSIFGYKQLAFIKDLFAGKKREIIESYLKLNKNRPKNKTFNKFNKFATVRVRSVFPTRGDWVYSLETVKPHSFVTSYGIVVHNCIPKDPLYLYWKAKLHGFKSRFIKLASDLNSAMPAYVVERINTIRPLKGSRVMVLGVTYKKDVKDLRKSPSLEIIELLRNAGSEVHYADPLIPYLKFTAVDLRATSLTAENISRMDCVVVVTDHSGFDYELILKNAKVIFDTRNVYKNVKNDKIIRL